MFRANGLYGHVQLNVLRSVLCLAGFMLAFQLVVAVVLFFPLLFLDSDHFVILAPWAYLRTYGLGAMLLGLGMIAVRLTRHEDRLVRTLRVRFVGTREAAGLCKMVAEQGQIVGLPNLRLGIIDDPGRNALSLGLSKKNAAVVLTTGLIKSLGKAELRAVIAYQVAHVRRGDTQLLVAATVAADGIEQIRSANKLRPRRARTLMLLFVTGLLLPILMLAFLDQLAVTIARYCRLVGASSRSLICDADVVAATHDATALVRALRRVENGPSLTIEERYWPFLLIGPSTGAYAAHRSISERVQALQRHAGGLAVDHRARATDPASSGPRPRKRMLSRISQGVDEDVFGFSGWARRVMVGIMVLTVSVPFLTLARVGKVDEAPRNPEFVRADKRFALERTLSSQGPEEARCFSGRKRSFDSLPEDLADLDPQMIDDYASGRTVGPSYPLRFEKLLGARRRSAVDATNALRLGVPEITATALSSYLSTRQHLTSMALSVQGADGYAVMNEAYDTERDAALLDVIVGRTDPSDWPSGTDELAIATLLIDDPSGFVPCWYKAKIVSETWTPTELTEEHVFHGSLNATFPMIDSAIPPEEERTKLR